MDSEIAVRAQLSSWSANKFFLVTWESGKENWVDKQLTSNWFSLVLPASVVSCMIKSSFGRLTSSGWDGRRYVTLESLFKVSLSSLKSLKACLCLWVILGSGAAWIRKFAQLQSVHRDCHHQKFLPCPCSAWRINNCLAGEAFALPSEIWILCQPFFALTLHHSQPLSIQSEMQFVSQDPPDQTKVYC